MKPVIFEKGTNPTALYIYFLELYNAYELMYCDLTQCVTWNVFIFSMQHNLLLSYTLGKAAPINSRQAFVFCGTFKKKLFCSPLKQYKPKMPANIAKH